MADLDAEVLAEVRRVLAEELEVARPVEPDDELRGDLLVDSMGAIVLAVALEDRFRVKLPDDGAAAVVTVRDLVALVRRAKTGDEVSPAPAGAREVPR
ncbi:MAG TPA: acyl carrier protein [Thermoanaerobaculaceae bacterium]|nr:acyl carrier protein [Thermoanaerobaculaceae bacterium]